MAPGGSDPGRAKKRAAPWEVARPDDVGEAIVRNAGRAPNPRVGKSRHHLDGAASRQPQYQNDQQDYHEHGYYQAYGVDHDHLPSRPQPRAA
jgi:hypothetical protein